MNAAERIYVASTSAGETRTRLAEALARLIEDDIASRNLPPGGAIGSLRELSARYAVGKSVAREAIGLLERRGLGRMRPGPCGGFILATPRSDAIGEALADHFRATGVTLRQLMDAREAVDLMAARLAASTKPDAAVLARLKVVSEGDSLSHLLAARFEIARLAAEPVVLLLVECLNRLTRDFGESELSGSRRGGRSNLDAMCRALRAGDSDAAAAEAAETHRELAALLVERQKPISRGSTESSSSSATAGKLSAAIARRLAEEIVSIGAAGTRVGSEWDLCERFNVSRLTLRQAIRQLQDSGLVECRRGRGNGLVVRDARAAGSIRLMLAYLIGARLKPMTAGTILFQVNCFVPALAVSRANDAQRQQLEAALSRVESSDPFDRFDLLSLVHCASRLADNPIIDLFSRCLAAYEARFRPSLAEWLPARAQTSYFQLLRRFLNRLPMGSASDLEWAKRESSALMLDMSRHRPI